MWIVCNTVYNITRVCLGRRAIVVARNGLAALLLLSAPASACPVCLGPPGSVRSIAQDISDAGASVLASPTLEPRRFRISTVLKGRVRDGELITVAAVDMPRTPLPEGVPILLSRHGLLGTWRPLAAVPDGHQDWLGRIAAQRRLADMTAAEMTAAARTFAGDLSSPFPLVRETAARELRRMPYTTLTQLRNVLDPRALVSAFDDQTLRLHAPLLDLLIALTGGEEARAHVTQALANDVAGPRLPALLTGAIALGGADEAARLVALSLQDDHGRERAAALVAALATHVGDDDTSGVRLSRREVIQSFERILDRHPQVAGHMIGILESWRDRSLIPALTRISRRDDLDEGSRLLLAAYLAQTDNPLPTAAAHAP
jgi:hypothetical protein